MFFQLIFEVLLIILAFYCIWKYVLDPIFKAAGIEKEEVKKDIKTAQTIRLKILKDKYEKITVSQKASEESVALMEKIKDLEDKIKESNIAMKELKK